MRETYVCLCGKMFEVCWMQGVKHKKKKKLGGVPLAKKKKKKEQAQNLLSHSY